MKTLKECLAEIDGIVNRAKMAQTDHSPIFLARFEIQFLRILAATQLYELGLERGKQPTACADAQYPLSGQIGTCEARADSFADRPAAGADGPSVILGLRPMNTGE